MTTLHQTEGFSFTVDSSVLLSGLSKVNSIAGASKTSDAESAFLLFADDKKLYALSYTQDTFCYVRIEAKVKGDGYFKLDFDTFVKTMKGRKELEIKVGKQVEVKSGRYNVKLNFSEVPGNFLAAIENYLKVAKGEKMKSSDMQKIRNAIKQVDIQDIYAGGKNCCYLVVKDGNMVASSYDNFHMVLLKEKVKYRDTQVAFHSSTFRLLDKFIGDADVSLFVGRHLRVEADDFVVCLPPVQVEEAQFTITQNYMKGLADPLASFELNSAAIKALHNISGIIEGDDKMDITVADGRVEISIKSQKGSISDNYKCKTDGEAKFTVDPRVLLDLYRKVSLPATVHLHGGGRGTSAAFSIKQGNLRMTGSYYES